MTIGSESEGMARVEEIRVKARTRRDVGCMAKSVAEERFVSYSKVVDGVCGVG